MGNSDSKKGERRYKSFKEKGPSIASENRADILRTKQNLITDDYELYSKNPKILGTGINGKVVICQHKSTKKKYALKVIIYKAIFKNIEKNLF